jgi:hypothetical protein
MFGADLASVGAKTIIGAILGSDVVGDVAVGFKVKDGGDVEEDRSNHDVDIVVVVLQGVDGAADEVLGLLEGEV